MATCSCGSPVLPGAAKCGRCIMAATPTTKTAVVPISSDRMRQLGHAVIDALIACNATAPEAIAIFIALREATELTIGITDTKFHQLKLPTNTFPTKGGNA
jgi:hypothetical protein